MDRGAEGGRACGQRQRDVVRVAQSDQVRNLPKRSSSTPGPLAPALPGLTLCRPLTDGRPGPPWRAKDLRTGYDVVVRPVPPGVDAAELAKRLSAVPEHAHLLRPTLVADAPDGPVLVTRFAAKGCLADLLARRGALGAGECSSLGQAVGRALAALHAAGLVHGAVDASAVLVDAAARPFLDVTPMLAVPVRGTDVPEVHLGAADVAALAGLLRDSSQRPLPVETAELLAAAAAPGADLPASELVGRLVAAVPPEPLRLVLPDRAVAEPAARRPSLPRPRVPSRPRRRARRSVLGPVRRTLGVAACVVGALSLAVWAGTAWARYADGDGQGAGSAVLAAAHPPPMSRAPGTPAPAGTSAATVAGRLASSVPAPPVDWTRVLADLDSRREEAFSSDDPDALTDVDAPGSAVLASDVAALRSLAAAGVDAAGFREVIRSVRPLTVTARRVVLAVVDVRPAYTLVRVADGGTVASRPARPAKAWAVELVPGPVGWQIRSVRAS